MPYWRVRLAGYHLLKEFSEAPHRETIDEEVCHYVSVDERNSYSMKIQVEPPQRCGVFTDKVGHHEVDRNRKVGHYVDGRCQDHCNYSLPLQLGLAVVAGRIFYRFPGLVKEEGGSEHDYDVWDKSDDDEAD